MAQFCCSAPVFDEQPMKHCPQVGAVPNIPMTADVTSLAEMTDVSCSGVHGAGRASAGTSAAVSAGAAVVAASSGGEVGVKDEGSLLAQAIAQLVESFALAHAIRHCPHGGLLPISATTADVLSAAVPTFVTSAIVHAAAEDTLACRVVISREAASAPATKELSKISTAIMTADI